MANTWRSTDSHAPPSGAWLETAWSVAGVDGLVLDQCFFRDGVWHRSGGVEISGYAPVKWRAIKES